MGKIENLRVVIEVEVRTVSEGLDEILSVLESNQIYYGPHPAGVNFPLREQDMESPQGLIGRSFTFDGPPNVHVSIRRCKSKSKTIKSARADLHKEEPAECGFCNRVKRPEQMCPTKHKGKRICKSCWSTRP